MKPLDKPEFIPKIPININVLESLELDAAKRVVNYEIDNNISLGKFFDNGIVLDELIFPGDSSEMTKTLKDKITLDVSKLILQSTGSKRKLTNLDRLSGLEEIIQKKYYIY